jgi:hypothetical protein
MTGAGPTGNSGMDVLHPSQFVAPYRSRGQHVGLQAEIAQLSEEVVTHRGVRRRADRVRHDRDLLHMPESTLGRKLIRRAARRTRCRRRTRQVRAHDHRDQHNQHGPTDQLQKSSPRRAGRRL